MSVISDRALSRRLPTTDEEESARRAARLLARSMTGDGALSLCLRDRDETVDLPKSLGDLLLDLLGHIGQGETVTLIPHGSLLSTQQAADLLNVSRPFLIKLIDAGELSCIKVGTHRRLKATEVFAYRDRREQEQATSLDELVRLRQEMEAS